jgi:hypothetical protein
VASASKVDYAADALRIGKRLAATRVASHQLRRLAELTNNNGRIIHMRKLITMLVAAIFAAASLTVVAAESSGGDVPKASAKKSDKAKKAGKSKKSKKAAKNK